MAYSKGKFAKQLGISRGELKKRARDAGYSTTEAFFNATGGTGKSPVDAVMEAAKRAIEEETGYLKDYLEKNPFAFDEELAKQSSTAQYEPYYQELLEDYLSDIDVQRKTVEDDQRLSTYLNEYTVGKKTREYARAEESAREGFAGSGMFFSGIKKKAMGELGIEKGAEMGAIGERYGREQTGYGTQLGVLDTSAQRQERDVGREQETAIAGGIEQRREEALKPYYNTMTSQYYRKFPSINNPFGGYVPPEYLRL